MPQKYNLNRKSKLSPPLKITVCLGGTSPERNISLRSGKAILHALKRCGFPTRPLDPAKHDPRDPEFADTDVFFIALHGEGGEDGVFQSLLNKKRAVYTGSDVKGCRLSYDKGITKRVLDKSGILTPPGVLLRRDNWEKQVLKIPPPFFIKPVQDGSSLGIFCIEDLQKEKGVIKKNLEKYGRLIAEKKIQGREFTVSVLGTKTLPVIELKPQRPFYDYKAKYTKGLCRYLVPAPVSAGIERRLRRTALRAHNTLRLRDLSRIDLMMDREGEIFVLEANSIPGFTELSLLPKAARAAGITFDELCRTLVMKAYQRTFAGRGR